LRFLRVCLPTDHHVIEKERRMRIFVAGATGAVGTRLVPLLCAAGHAVTGLTHDSAKAAAIRQMGAEAAVADALDGEAVKACVAAAKPDVIVHELTSLANVADLRNPDASFALTNRLRTEATDHLIAAGRAAGIRRMIAQSYCGWPYARTGDPVKREEDPLDPQPAANVRATLAAIRHVESAVTGAAEFEGLALRYGGFYGPHTGAFDPTVVEQVRRRRFPVIGDGGGWWSFLHIDDAAAATALAAERGHAGVYNIVDDEPATVAEWLPELAAMLGAKPPRHVPTWVGRLATGEVGVAMMTQSRGSSNAKARRELGWEPAHPSWRSGFAETVGAPAHGVRSGR
jgi:nucleoside-diphosphate-sugar epimerase